VRCHEPDLPAFPCNALCDADACPLESGAGVDVVLDHRAHPHPRPTPLEDGVTCAVRQYVPLVVAGTSALNPFAPWTTAIAGDTDVVAACVTAAGGPLDRLAEPARLEVWRRLAAHPAAAAASGVTVQRNRARLDVTVSVPSDAPGVDEQLAVAVAGVIRRHNRYTSQIDVAVKRVDPVS
jgi:hypothetical protein